MMVKNFIQNNIIAIIAGIFTLGGFSTVVTMQGVEIGELKQKVQEIEENKVSMSVLMLKEQTLNARLDEMRENHLHLEQRVRRKIDGDLNEMKHLGHELDTQTQVHANDIEQAKDELKGIWKFINKFLEEMK